VDRHLLARYGGGGKACRLSAPPELLAPMAPQNVLVVEEISNDAYRVTIEVRDAGMDERGFAEKAVRLRLSLEKKQVTGDAQQSLWA
jgi:hypothetical protein